MMMEGNLLLEQYGRFKKAELEESPFQCLLNTNIEINPIRSMRFVLQFKL